MTLRHNLLGLCALPCRRLPGPGRYLAAGLFLLALVACGRVEAQELGKFEGCSMGSNAPAAGTALEARGLMLAIYSPLTSDTASREYTWVMSGLVAQATSYLDSTYSTAYDVSQGVFTIWEDPCRDAEPSFYDCPAGVVGRDPHYANDCAAGQGPYLTGKIQRFTLTHDTHANASDVPYVFLGLINWTGGTHLTELGNKAGAAWAFGANATDQYPCLPLTGDPQLGPYQQALVGRFYNFVFGIRSSTWGQIRRIYR